MAPFDIKDFVLNLVQPWIFIAISLSHVPQTVLGIIRSGQYDALLNINEFCDLLFGNFWATVGPQVKENNQDNVIALLEGHVREGAVHKERVNFPVYGTVIEVGAGSGMWADVLAKVSADNAQSSKSGSKDEFTASKGIDKIYGVEPNVQSAAALRKRVKEVGLNDIYEVVPVGIESVADPKAWSGQILPESVDCIVGVLCLCSIPDPELNIKYLYQLLKPGGKWYVYEHVKATRGGPLLQLYQRFVNIPWSYCIGSCRLCRDTRKSLMAAGTWSQVDLAQPSQQPAYHPLPHIMGTLVK